MTEKFLKNLGEHLNTIKQHLDRDNDDPDYKVLRKIENLFSEVDEEDYYKPVKLKSAFNDNYIEYKSRGDIDKDFSTEEYLDVIRPYLRDMIDNHKAPIKVKDPSNKISDDNSYGERKIQLTLQISFFFFRHRRNSYNGFKE